MAPAGPFVATHFGAFRCVTRGGRLIALEPHRSDKAPNRLADGYIDALYHADRPTMPLVRREWLQHGPKASRETRGKGPFDMVPWDHALALVANEFDRVRQMHGNEAVYAGSYGWASAGRFHHAQSQLKRFLNLAGGSTSSVNSYSYGAGGVIVPHILGSDYRASYSACSTFDGVADHTRLWLLFGGLAGKNSQIEAGGIGSHDVPEWLARIAAARVECVSVSPDKSDTPDILGAKTLQIRPGTDTALILSMATEIILADRADMAFLDRYTVGFAEVRAYLTGAQDETIKGADWAAPICGIDPQDIRDLALKACSTRTMISVAWSVQRARFGEQPLWAAITLAAVLGQIGLPGGGFSFGHGSVGTLGLPYTGYRGPAVPQGINPVDAFIPVAALTELLERPGGTLAYNGETLHLPDIRLIWWAGGNPFHHHHDLNRLRRAWHHPETVIVQENSANALVQHADIVLPVTFPMERNDIGISPRDRFVVANRKACQPHGQARDDFAILADLAELLGFRDSFTANRSELQWIQWIYEGHREHAPHLPPFDRLWNEIGVYEAPAASQWRSRVLLSEFRGDPVRARLKTPSGKIELYSKVIEAFSYDDCPAHASWLEPEEGTLEARSSQYPLQLLSNQPAHRLHSQLDQGRTANAAKRGGLEVVRMSPQDARQRGIADGDTLCVFNARGSLLCSASLSQTIRPGVVQIATGGWFQPQSDGVDAGGNPNSVTSSIGSSRLSWGSAANTCWVDVKRGSRI